MNPSPPWRIWIDTGGTFTDAVGVDPQGGIHRVKVLSSSSLRGTVERVLSATQIRASFKPPLSRDIIRGLAFQSLAAKDAACRVRAFDPVRRVLELENEVKPAMDPGMPFEVRSPEEAPVLAARLLTGTPLGVALPPIEMRLATTRGTNALLERRGAPVALFITRGFGDLLAIGTQQRPDLFALDVRKPPAIHESAVEVDERMAADGSIVMPLDRESLQMAAVQVLDRGIRSAAVAFLHSHVNPAHEKAAEACLRGMGFEHVSSSSDLSPFQRILPRAQTAVIDAYLAPVVGVYLSRVGSCLGAGRLHVMTSAGGLTKASAFRPKDGLLSGPAGGVIGAAAAAGGSGIEKAITLDMGGTSTDVARFDGAIEYVFEHEVAAARIRSPALAVESVAAGGGSICAFDGHALAVGPQSAGAEPGPACYGAGGPLTITDVNLLLGRLDPSRFEIPIRAGDADVRIAELLGGIEARAGKPPDRDAVLEGLLAIANELMAGAIRKVSVQKGFDPADYTLVAFGGAGGQHACAIASLLGMRSVLVPADAGLLSALGLGRAAIERFAERQIIERLDRAAEKVPAWIAELEAQAKGALETEGVDPEDAVVLRRIASVRLLGQDTAVQVECGEETPIERAFADRYRAIFGHSPEGRPLELESLRVVAAGRIVPDATAPQPRARFLAKPEKHKRARLGGGWREVPVYERPNLEPGALLSGPALIFETHAAITVEEGWSAEVDSSGAVVLRRDSTCSVAPAMIAAPEAAQLELFTNRFRSIVEEMGEMLRRTALSTNVKERLDFSCAILDADGELVVNAPHIPVHLGALGVCVRALQGAIEMEPGDVVVTNHPAFGGSHLPDVTLVTPVFAREGKFIAYAASRAHHAEIGGATPGSMPPHATCLAEEGVVIPPTHAVRSGHAQWDAVRRLLESGAFPSRAVEENLADMLAAAAANHRGASSLLALAGAQGVDTVSRYMARLKDHAAARMREALRRLPPGLRTADEEMDGGSRLAVAIDIQGDHASIDFSGSAGVHRGNLNATPAIVRSVVLYVLRFLVDEPMPLNEGILAPIDIRLPEGILNPPFPDDPSLAPAVFGGNVETSQRLAGVLIRALGLCASSQGTMNNVIFGTDSFGYYETVCGGCGAGPGFDGASVVHSHMTNTSITDPEVLEHRYPVRLERFAVRRGSGGAGRHRGGDGAVREILFRAPVRLSVLGEHRKDGPLGLAGGGRGKPGTLRVVRASGEVSALGSAGSCDIRPGDRFIIETPGGGGYGKPV